MAGGEEATNPLDPRRLERILAPFAARSRGPAVSIVDPDGVVLAGPAWAPAAGQGPMSQPSRGRRDGRRAGRRGRQGTADPGLGPAIEALAVALGELATESIARSALVQALGTHRSEHSAAALGIDTAELAKGRRQQRSILSLEAPDVPGYELASHYAAAREIGGDFFELFRLPKRGRPLAIVVADVTGKGLDAALLMAFARPVMHSALDASRGPAEAIDRTNRVLVGEHRGTLFITMLCAVLQPSTRRVRIASAGHEPPLLVPGDGGPIREVGRAGVIIGAFASIEPPETELDLAPGDTLLCYTDGVTDARSPSGERFGDERLLATVEAARDGGAHDLVAAVRDRVQAFQQTADPADDITLVAVGRRAVRPRRAARR